MITGPSIRSVVDDALGILESSEAVDTAFENELNDIRDSIDKFRDKIWHGAKDGKELQQSDPATFKKLDALMHKLHDIDNQIAQLL